MGGRGQETSKWHVYWKREKRANARETGYREAIKLTPCLAVTANDVASTWIRVEAGPYLIVEW